MTMRQRQGSDPKPIEITEDVVTGARIALDNAAKIGGKHLLTALNSDAVLDGEQVATSEKITPNLSNSARCESRSQFSSVFKDARLRYSFVSTRASYIAGRSNDERQVNRCADLVVGILP
jgi:hypothetical protein